MSRKLSPHVRFFLRVSGEDANRRVCNLLGEDPTDLMQLGVRVAGGKCEDLFEIPRARHDAVLRGVLGDPEVKIYRQVHDGKIWPYVPQRRRRGMLVDHGRPPWSTSSRPIKYKEHPTGSS